MGMRHKITAFIIITIIALVILFWPDSEFKYISTGIAGEIQDIEYGPKNRVKIIWKDGDITLCTGKIKNITNLRKGVKYKLYSNKANGLKLIETDDTIFQDMSDRIDYGLEETYNR